jgi:hypothetical protein
LLEESDRSGAEIKFTGAELLRRVDKQGKERRLGAAIDQKFYGNVIPTRGQLSSIYAQVNRRANDIIAIEQIYTTSGEGCKYVDFSAMLRVVLTAFKLTYTAKERRIKIGIALDLAHLRKILSVFTVSIITSDSDDIDPNTGGGISEFFNVRYDRFIDCPLVPC